MANSLIDRMVRESSQVIDIDEVARLRTIIAQASPVIPGGAFPYTYAPASANPIGNVNGFDPVVEAGDPMGFDHNDFALGSYLRSLDNNCRENDIQYKILTTVLNNEMSYGVSLTKRKWGIDEHHQSRSLRNCIDASVDAIRLQLKRRES